MTKIDETKQYKFSEIVRMIEDGELPEGTKVAASGVSDYLLVANELNINKLNSSDGNNIAMFNFDMLFSRSWTIKLPEEDKFYLKAPDGFDDKYLNLNTRSQVYFLTRDKTPLKTHLNCYKTQFTQSEIDAMPFDTNFFEKIKVEDE